MRKENEIMNIVGNRPQFIKSIRVSRELRNHALRLMKDDIILERIFLER